MPTRSNLPVWLALLVLGTAPVATADTARGFVFEDLDGDGQRSESEPGVSNVRVSNGVDVVATDDRGRWALDVGQESVVFLTKPAGWATPVDADQLPRFYYIHQPDGSPATLRYPGIAPTGPLPVSIDFPLVRYAEPERFSVVLFADTQPQSEAEVDYIRDTVVPELIGTDAAFGMTLGDIMFDELSLYPRYNRVISRIGIPWRNVPGNHEIDYSAPNDRYSLETFKRWFGPTYYAFEYGNALFVVLDNIEYRGRSDAEYPVGLRAGGTFVARISDDQLTWLGNELEHVPDDRLIVLTMHSPLKTNTGKPERPEANVMNRQALFRVLRGRSKVHAIAGHTHMIEHVYFGAAEGWQGPGELHHQMLAAVSGSWWSGPIDPAGVPISDLRDGAPRGYHVLEIDGTRLRTTYKAVGRPADYQMRILFDVWHNAGRPDLLRDFRPGELLDGRFSVDEVPSAAVVVNLFAGGPRSVVEYSIDGGDWQDMPRRIAPDPYLVEALARNRASIKSWVEPVPSTHLYVADLPDDLEPGTYTVNVRATDEFGAAHRGTRILEITGSSAPPPGKARR
jgi:hypothetical protein